MNDKNINQEVEALFNLGAHLGHKKNRLHPKSKKYVYTMMDGVSIIDLTKTVTMLHKAKEILAQAAKEEKMILVVATKKVINQYALDLCKKHGIPAITTKWMPGLLTNFDTIIKNVKKMQTMRDQQSNGEWNEFVKHERMKLAKELFKLEKLYGGIDLLTRKPDYLLIVDIKKEKNSIKEAKDNNIPVIAIGDTNANPDEVDYVVMVNDDAPQVVEHVMNELIQAYAKK